MSNGDNSQSTAGLFLLAESAWFEDCLEARITEYFKQQETTEFPIAPDLHSDTHDSYLDLVVEHNLNVSERLVLMLGLIPTIKPNALDIFLTKNKNTDRPFAEFGGVPTRAHGGFLPTFETALFILSGNDISLRVRAMDLLNPENSVFKHGLIQLIKSDSADSDLTAELRVSDRILRQVTGFNRSVVSMGANFPAQKISTAINPDELVVSDDVLDELALIKVWVQHREKITSDTGLGRFVLPGYRCLFWGPPGTGKTLAAGLLGQSLGIDVYRIDLSMVVSKWIGETEKNLSAVFDEAEHNGWILFFDEADALFARRSVSSSSNDRYSNQQVSYLLQRMETFTGVAILSTNLKTNLDEALMRRLQSFVHFAMPNVSQREKLWETMLDSIAHDSVDLRKLSEGFELSGGVIANVVQYAALLSLKNGREEIIEDDLQQGIARELRKEGRSVL